MIATLLRLELRRAVRDRALLALVLLYALLAAYAVHSGVRWASARTDMLTLVEREATDGHRESREALAEQARSGKAPPNSAMYASAVGFRATLPNRPLAALSSGQAESYPMAAVVSPFADPTAIFERFEAGFENPAVLAAGRFDLAFVVVVLMPLLLLAGLYDLWSGERERGLARMQLAEPVGAVRIVGAKAGARGALLLLPMILLTVALLASLAGSDPAGLGMTAATMLAYGLFWIALAFAINVFARRSTVAAIGCGTAWLAAVILLPALVASAVDAAYPRPSAVAQLNRVRAEWLAVRALREKTPAAMPAEASRTSIPDRLRVARREIEIRDARAVPLVARYQAAIAARRDAANSARLLSPAALAQDSLDRIAGTDAARAIDYQRQARAFVGAARAFSDERFAADRLLTPADFGPLLPRFRMTEPGRSRAVGFDLIALLLFAGAAAFVGTAGLRRRPL